ncbi:hypothetical protein LCGC14_2572190, partial [marine sediment metagenome]
DLLFDLSDYTDSAWNCIITAEIHPLSPTQVDQTSVMDLH